MEGIVSKVVGRMEVNVERKVDICKLLAMSQYLGIVE